MTTGEPAVAVRRAVRAVVLDDDGNMLLIRARDSEMPELGEWCELPGGGLNSGENAVTAEIRELHEETGLHVTPAQVQGPTWHRVTAYRFRGGWRVQSE